MRIDYFYPLKTDNLLLHRFFFRLIFLFIGLYLCSSVLCAQSTGRADSIMEKVFSHTEIYGNYIREYDANAYIKGNTKIIKRNFLFRFAPDFLYMDKKNDTTLVETLVDIHFRSPNHFTQKIHAINGTNLDTDELQHRVMQFLNVNIYNPTSFNDEVLMPVTQNAFRYYRFEYISTLDTLGHTIFKIRVTPKIKSRNLISGHLYIVDQLWTILRIDVRGKSEFLSYRVKTNFGLPEKDFLLPLQTEVSLKLNVLGNELETQYASFFEYLSVIKYDEKEKRKKINYDLSDYFNVQMDSLPVIKDSLFWTENRPIPLTEEEKTIVESWSQAGAVSDSTVQTSKKRSWNFARGLFIPKRFEYNATQFRYSGLLNPFKFAYTKLDGVVYWQQLKLNKVFESGQGIMFRPDIGFVFERKEVYFNTPLTWSFQPRNMGQIELSLGNRNMAYSSKVIDQINEEVPDSIDFDDFNLEYYKHYYITLQGQRELTNGLLFYLGADYLLYEPVKKGGADPEDFRTGMDEDIIDLVDNDYRSFTPLFGFIWTPGQYYRMNGKQKEYLGSRFPTFSFEYARGISGVLQSNSHYERIEGDVQQKIPLGLLRSVQYYAGAGCFTNTESVYFADFKKFTKRNFPRAWDDPIGGVFHLLDGNWYNASDSYIQAHAMYEAPFMLLYLFRGVTRDVLKERFYLSQLYTPALPSYTEVGYGVGNHLINVGAFVSFNKGEYESFGFKFAFELGR